MDMETETLDRLLRAGAAETIQTKFMPNGDTIVVTPDGYQMTTVPAVDRAMPSEVHQLVTLDTEASLIEYVNTFKEERTRLFVQRRPKPIFAAFFNYHKANNEDGAEAAYCSHIAKWELPYSLPLQRWMGLCARSDLSQPALLDFLEENGEDVVTPSAAELMAIVGKLSSRKKIEFLSAFRLGDGQTEFQYKEETETTGGVKNAVIPNSFEIGVPIFQDGDSYVIKVVLRHRINEGKLIFQTVLHRLDMMVDDALDACVQRVAEHADLTPFWGIIR